MFDQIISLENLFAAWKEFHRGKSAKRDVQAFEWNLEDSVFALHEDLKSGNYCHGSYETFYVCDPKRRRISKPPVRDRLLHHAIFRNIEPLFDRRFIYDVWSCRKGKGTHGAVERFQRLAWKLSRNNTRTVWVLKLDIRKYFDNVEQAELLYILAKTITDDYVMALLAEVVLSFPSGIPLGNLTSQLFANVYLNELDQFVKHELRARHYIRYCDDMVLFGVDRQELWETIPRIQLFLHDYLDLELHPNKMTLTRYHLGVDFLGFICFPHYRVVRTKTWRRTLRKVNRDNRTSYYGLLMHGRSYGRIQRLLAS